MRFVLSCQCAVLALLAIRLGWAEIYAQADTPESLKRAVALEHAGNAAHLERLAEFASAGGDAHQERALLRQAAWASPRQVSVWIARGLAAERAGDFEEAESALTQAARLDGQYLPAWTLTNYYYRRQNRERFWRWARAAAEMTYDDFRPLFRLCDALEPDDAAVADRLGDGRSMLRAHVTYLAGEGRRLAAAEVSAWRLIRWRNPEDRPVLANLITREIAANRAEPALALWNAAFPALDPERGQVLGNGNLDREPSAEGFDWRLRSCAGASSAWRPGRLRFALQGMQPDACVLLEQPIPVRKGKRYVLRFDCRLEAAAGGESSGLHWVLGPADIPVACAGSSQPSGSAAFRAEEDGVVPFQFLFRRAAGSVAFEGTAELRNLRMEVR